MEEMEEVGALLSVISNPPDVLFLDGGKQNLFFDTFSMENTTLPYLIVRFLISWGRSGGWKNHFFPWFCEV
jgi:hypothetical protein